MVRFNSLNAQVVGVSVNDPWSNKGFAEKNLLTFPLLSDFNRDVVELYDIELRDFAGLKGYSVTKRSVFIIDKNGIVRYRWVSEDPGFEPNYKEIEKALDQIL
jgi:peroxiredoxin